MQKPVTSPIVLLSCLCQTANCPNNGTNGRGTKEAAEEVGHKGARKPVTSHCAHEMLTQTANCAHDVPMGGGMDEKDAKESRAIVACGTSEPLQLCSRHASPGI